MIFGRKKERPKIETGKELEKRKTVEEEQEEWRRKQEEEGIAAMSKGERILFEEWRRENPKGSWEIWDEYERARRVAERLEPRARERLIGKPELWKKAEQIIFERIEKEAEETERKKEEARKREEAKGIEEALEEVKKAGEGEIPEEGSEK